MRVQINNEEEDRLVVENYMRNGTRAPCDCESELLVARVENNQIADCRVEISSVLIDLAESLNDVAGTLVLIGLNIFASAISRSGPS